MNPLALPLDESSLVDDDAPPNVNPVPAGVEEDEPVDKLLVSPPPNVNLVSPEDEDEDAAAFDL